MTVTVSFVRAIVLLSFAASCLGQTACSRHRGFREDDPCFDQASRLSPDVLASVLKTTEARETFEDMSPEERARVPELLKGIPVHLLNTNRKDMIVRGTWMLSGGDNTWFWVVTSVDHLPSATWVQGNSVEILKSRHRGHRDIQTAWAAGSHSAMRIFHFDGVRYKLFHEDYKEYPPSP